MDKIPEKWAVKRNKETCGTINFYFNTLGLGFKFTDDGTVNFRDKSRDCDYLHYPKCDNKVKYLRVQYGYEEISFDFFLDHIVNKKPIQEINLFPIY